MGFPYSSTLHTFLARVQGFLLIIAAHNSTKSQKTSLLTLGPTGKLFLIYRQARVSIQACGNHLFYLMIFITWGRLQKRFSNCFHSLTQSRGAWVSSETCINSSRKKLYQVRLANSARHNYLGLVQFDLANTDFCSKWGLLLVFFGLKVAHQVFKRVYTIHPRVVRFLLDMFCLVEQCLV